MIDRMFVATLAALSAAGVQAHITIENPVALAGSYAKVVLQVTHGCAGSPTTALAVHLPEGFLFAKAMVKPGWTVAYARTKLVSPIQLHGRTMSETTSVIRWEGAVVPNDQFDEFALLGKVAETASPHLRFRVLQTCERGHTDWRGGPDTKEPAPVLNVVPADSRKSHSHR